MKSSPTRIRWCFAILSGILWYPQLGFAQSDADVAPATPEVPAAEADDEASVQPGKRPANQPFAPAPRTRKEKVSTELNFEETLLEGQMRAPAGSILQGRKLQGKQQMVKLRRSFKRQLRHSRGGVQSATK